MATPGAEWEALWQLTSEEVAHFLWESAGMITLARYRKSKRGPKKLQPPRDNDPKKPHASPARLLAQRRRKS